MAWFYTDWEDTEYFFDLEAAIEDQATGAIPADSFVITRRVQLTAESTIPISDDALFIADHAIAAVIDGVAGITTPPYGAYPDDYDGMPRPDYTVNPDGVPKAAWLHALDGDGTTFPDWYTIDHHWSEIPAWAVPEGQHAELFHPPGTITPNPGIDLYEPYVNPIDGDTQTVTVSWQLIGDSVPEDDSYMVTILANAFPDGERYPFSGTTEASATVPIHELTVDLVIPSGERWGVFVQYSGSSTRVVGAWSPRGNLLPNPSTDAPAETTPGGRGFTVPSTWAWPLLGDGYWDQSRCVLAGSTWETSSERAGLTSWIDVLLETRDYTALDAANIRAYQGYWTVKGGSSWEGNFPPSDSGPPTTDSTIQFLYGPDATYEYSWTAMGTIEVSVGGMLRAAPFTPVQVVADIEVRPSAYAAPTSLHAWKTRADLAAETPAASNVVEVDPSVGATLHVATNTTLTTPEHPDVLTPVPMSFGEWGTVRAVVLEGSVQLIGQRRVKFHPTTVPPLQQRQRVSMTAVHATQFVAPDPPRFRAQGDL